MAIAYIALGSNLGDREGRVRRAIREMGSFCRVRKVSRLVETAPVGIADQPDFINAVAEIRTEISPRELMGEIRAIEKRMGRTPTVRGGPREIDLDLLAYDDLVVWEEGLQIPHPRMHERRFVLEPLAEINPGWVHPGTKIPVSELLAALPPAIPCRSPAKS